MTDITELAQREKFEAWARSQKLGLSYGDCGYVFSSTEMAWRAWMTSSAELAEALEKAQQRIDDLENDEVRQRLANAEHQLYMAKLAKNNLRASRKAQFRKRKAAEQRIAELESRTVKLPQRLQPGADGYDDWYVHSDDDGEYLKFDDVLAMLTAAGIKVEAE
ncbi:TPA: hypothetical protein ACGUD8_000926 [Klebsiella pneumoniae]|jgi:hypothetical protein|nr:MULTISPECIES: hypothetical protein [Klebsiella]DAZ78275.1 MAG TPA: hypothetical protein [Caudoviricetes sp.]AEJ96913.1 hypothetical protein KPN2242_04965 [Klebsiella pneumoniae KCTC 2242]AWG76138.1 hypothetical protein DBZ61_22025 [Klebsiella pneumoniae]AXF26182.1 hypothetical protein DTN91_00135 [Klebsiella pneumoniae subsp. pneumoniae]KPO02599.1 hypothetical protein AO842_03935 [Klebsiella sp. AA405]